VGGCRVGVEVLVPGENEEAAVGVKGRLEQLAEELAEEAATVYSCLVQT
jgi:hypothetical protein